MTDYGKVSSMVCPEEVVIDDFSVWVNSNITEISEEIEGVTFVSYTYDMVQYGKDEYILKLSKSNDELNKQLTDTQLALCEIYEGLVNTNG